MSKKGKSMQERNPKSEIRNPQSKGPGRPAGVATSEAPAAHAVKAACTVCGKSALKRGQVLSDLALPSPHTTPDGKQWSHRKITRAQFGACGTWQPLVEWYNG